MELKPGYKQTEAGLIPDDWKVLRFCDHFNIYAGGDVPKDSLSQTQSDDHPYPIFANAIQNKGLYGFTSVKRGQPDSVTITARGYLGHAEYREGPSFPIVRLLVLEPTGALDAKYTTYAINERVEFSIESTGVPQLTAPQVGKYAVAAPPTLEEQHAIARALSDVDALLEGLDRLIAKKRDLKQAAMQQLLTGESRLPGFSGTWKTITLGEIGMFLKGKGIKRDDVSDEGVACIRYGELYTEYNDYITNPRSRISRKVADTALPLKHGDILFAGSGETAEEIGKCAAYLADEEAYAGGDIVVLRPSGQNSLYLGHLLNHRVVAEQKARLGQGDAVVHISARNLAYVVVKLPPIDEQEAIARVLSDMDTEIAALEQRRAKTADLKQAMMQELLTGKTRLVEPQASDEQTEAAAGNAKGHNWAINEAVVIATLVKHFGKEDYPLGRKRYTKLSYLLHRRVEQQAEGYLKKAAGPYNPQTKYGGPEKIAKQNGYIAQHKGPKGHSGFIAADNIAQAEGYFEKWYGPEVIQWLEQFRYKKNDDLEVLATVDMAAVELRASGKTVDVAAVKDVITSHPEWEAKLDRAAFSDANIAEAIEASGELFSNEVKH